MYFFGILVGILVWCISACVVFGFLDCVCQCFVYYGVYFVGCFFFLLINYCVFWYIRICM